MTDYAASLRILWGWGDGDGGAILDMIAIQIGKDKPSGHGCIKGAKE